MAFWFLGVPSYPNRTLRRTEHCLHVNVVLFPPFPSLSSCPAPALPRLLPSSSCTRSRHLFLYPPYHQQRSLELSRIFLFHSLNRVFLLALGPGVLFFFFFPLAVDPSHYAKVGDPPLKPSSLFPTLASSSKKPSFGCVFLTSIAFRCPDLFQIPDVTRPSASRMPSPLTACPRIPYLSHGPLPTGAGPPPEYFWNVTRVA